MAVRLQQSIICVNLMSLCTGEKKVFTPNMWAGCLAAIGGFCLYSHFKLQAIQSKVETDQQLTPLLGMQC
jgi:hypothetical protein